MFWAQESDKGTFYISLSGDHITHNGILCQLVVLHPTTNVRIFIGPCVISMLVC